MADEEKRTRLEIENDLAPQQQQPANALAPWGNWAPESVTWGDPEAASATAAARGAGSEIGSYLQDVVTGQHAKRKLFELFPPPEGWDPKKSFLENAQNVQPRGIHRNPETGEVEISPTAWELAGAFAGNFKAYHGTGAKFNKFDPAFYETGEGTQLLGPGFYVAGNKEVAKTYVPPGQLILDGKPWHHNANLPLEHPHNRASAELIEARGNVDAALESLRDNVNFASKKKNNQFWQQEKINAENTIKFIEDNRDKITTGKGGHLLDVWVKPEHNEFLDWDLKFKDQDPLVQDKILNHFPHLEADVKDLTGSQIYDAVMLYQAAHGIGDDFGESAVRALSTAGIPGMRYLDAGSRGSKSVESTHNYVVYDPSNLEITHRDGRRLIPVDHDPFKKEPSK